MHLPYLPYSERTPDYQYQDLLRRILKKGVIEKSAMDVEALTLFGMEKMSFDLRNGFPIITERSIKSFWKKPIGEICAFINGARTLDELDEFGCRNFWAPWATAEKCAKRGLEIGDLGPGSYGAAFHDFPTQEGTPFNQFKHIVEQIKELPHLRTHRITPWIPQYAGRGKGKQQKVLVVPCHGDIFVRIINNGLYLTMVQRSGDVPIGVPSNMVQYAALTLMLSLITGYEPRVFTHAIVDAHIYVNQTDHVKEIISRGPRPFPTVEIDQTINDLFAFRSEHFNLLDYNPHPSIPGIPVTV